MRKSCNESRFWRYVSSWAARVTDGKELVSEGAGEVWRVDAEGPEVSDEGSEEADCWVLAGNFGRRSGAILRSRGAIVSLFLGDGVEDVSRDRLLIFVRVGRGSAGVVLCSPVGQGAVDVAAMAE